LSRTIFVATLIFQINQCELIIVAIHAKTTKIAQMRTRIMNIFPSSVEGWNTLFQAISIIFVAGTVLAGFGTIVTGRIVSRNQARDLAQANAEAAKANKGVADTALEIAKAQEETARLTKEAETAKTERAEADKQIAIAKADAARAKEGIANAEAQSAKASGEVAGLQVVVANAEQKRAEAERALLELQQRIKPRRFTAEERTRLIAALKASTPKGLIEIDCVLGDGEGIAFASQIDEILKAADWPTTGVNQSVFGPSNPVGAGLLVHSLKDLVPHAVALQKAFFAAGIPLQAAENDKRPKGTVQILVGNKP
jgi:hypothetical protein